MSETRFTRGPWMLFGEYEVRHCLNEDDELASIWGLEEDGEGVRVGYLFTTNNGAADAPLIAAAPELYAAADAAMPILLSVLVGAKQQRDTEAANIVGAVVQMIANAVAKARGQS